MMRQIPSTARELGEDAGFILVEVLVSAALLIMVTLAVFTTLDQGDRLAGQQARRAMAANMAQAEIERVRSLPIEDVAGLKGSRDVTDPSFPKIKFKITSTSRWVTDGGDEPICTTRSGGLDYMRLTTKVEWAGQGTAAPVQFSTVVTPASRASSTTNGSLSVNIAKADGTTGVSGLAVTITGTGGTFTETTNSSGCVVFPFVPAGPYQLQFNRAGWVNQNSVNDVDDAVNVAAGQTTKVSYLYDQGGTTKAVFKTYRAPLLGILPQQVATNPKGITLFNNDQTSGVITELMSGTTDTWATNTPLFPSTSPYSVFAGTCGDNNPGADSTFVNIPAGGYQNAGTVKVPSYDVRVLSGTSAVSPGNPIDGAKVVFTSGCGASYERYTTGGTSILSAFAGRLTDPGFPYSKQASICVSYRIGTTYWKYTKGSILNTDVSASPAIQNVYLTNTASGSVSSSSSSNVCTV